ncbi:MAG: ATP-binding protein [bacterium]
MVVTILPLWSLVFFMFSGITNLSITQKLMIGFLVVIFCTITVGTFAYVSLLRVSYELREMSGKLDPSSPKDREVIRSTDRLNRIAARDRVILFAGTMLSFIATLGVSLFLANRFADPVISLAKKAESIGQGQLNERIAISSHDEIGELAGAFNRMAASLQDRRVEIERVNQELERRDRVLCEANAKLERLNAIKSDFLSIVSHELRTPLTVIKGYISLIKNQRLGPVNEQQLKGLTIADERADHLNSLISDLLDLSRIELDKYEIRQEVSDFARMAGVTIDSMRPLFEKKGIRFTTRIPDGLPQVYADKQKVSQVLTNLLSNAMKFTPARGEVVLEAFPEVEEGAQGENWPAQDFVQINVSDTGIGLDEEEIHKIFDKFYQVDNSATREHGGTGLGLCIARNIVDLHHGRMWVKSRKGEGSTFSFTLPRAGRALTEAAGTRVEPSDKKMPCNSLTAEDAPDRQQDARKRHILVVDDNPVIRDLIITCISRQNWKIATAGDGIEALEKIFQDPVDLILLDISLPKLSGYDLCQIIKINEKTRNIPVIILSASAQRSEIERGFQMGANDYITHPFVPEDVVRRIHNLMNVV